MVIVELAAAAVAGLLPVLGCVADGAATKVGEKAVESGGQLLNWIRTHGRPQTVEALERLETAPDDVVARKDMETALVQQLEDAPAQAAELQAIVLNSQTTINVNNAGAINNQNSSITGVMTNSNGSSITIGS